MTLLSTAHIELRLFIERIEAEAAHLRARSAAPAHWQDHGTNCIGTLVETLQRIEPGLGLRLLSALLPAEPPVRIYTGTERRHTVPGALS